MGKRHPNPRLVKIHRSYTVTEIADLFGLHKNTVRRWIQEGLSTIDSQRPMLVLGQELAAFLKARRVKRKKRCKLGQIYCVRCRSPKYPAGNMVDYSHETEKVGCLTAICPDCDSIINQYVSLAKIGKIYEKLEVTFQKAQQHIVDCNKPGVNVHFREGV